MIKRLSVYGIVLILFPIFIYYLHSNVLVNIAAEASVPLNRVYLFNGIFSFLICVTALYLTKSKTYSDQIGFLYLASVVLKLISFFLIFYKPVFKVDALTNTQIANLLIPIMLFLVFEVVLIRNLLNNNS